MIRLSFLSFSPEETIIIFPKADQNKSSDASTVYSWTTATLPSLVLNSSVAPGVYHGRYMLLLILSSFKENGKPY